MNKIEYNNKKDNILKINIENKRFIYFFKRISNMTIYIILLFISIKLLKLNIMPSLIINGLISPLSTIPLYNILINKEEKKLKQELEILKIEYSKSISKNQNTITNNNIKNITFHKTETIDKPLTKKRKYPY